MSDSDTRYLVSYHKFTDKFLFFDKDEVLTTRTVYLNQGVPDISSELASNFSYLSFDKKGLNAVPEDYKVTKDISLYVNYKTDVNVKTYVVTYMDCKNSVAFTQADFDLLNTRVVNENSKYDLTVDTADLQSGSSILYFVGWSYDKNGKHMVTDNDVVTGDVTLYAQYSVDNVAPKSNNGIFSKAANYFDELYQEGGIPVGVSAVLAWLTVFLSFVLIIYIVFMLIRKLLIR